MRVRAWRAQPGTWSGRRRRRWLLVVGDAALAVALAAVFYLATGDHYGDRRVGIALILLQTLPLAVRRRYPVGVLAVVVAASLGTVAAEGPGRFNGGAGVVLLVALYSVAAYCPRRQAAWAGIAAGAVLAWPLWAATAGIAPLGVRLSVVVVSLGFPALGWVGGAYVSELRGRAARSRREQELETGRAVAEEQARVGRELHDVIAHTLSVIVIQAGAAGLQVTARVDGAPAGLPAGLDLAAYRIVQEALTNTLKHARAQAAEVHVCYGPAGLVVEVTDDGRAAARAGQRGPGRGRGLIGIGERAALHGGTCQAGPRPGGGFAVRVAFPVDALGRAGTLASGIAPVSPGQTAPVTETDMSWKSQPDPRSRLRWRGRLLIVGDAALALALAAGALAATGPPGPDRAAGIALALLGTLPLAVRRRYPVGVLAVVVAATLATMAAEIAGHGSGLGPAVLLVLPVALYSVAAHCPRRQAAWAGIATGAVLAWPLLRLLLLGARPPGQSLGQIVSGVAVSLGFSLGL